MGLFAFVFQSRFDIMLLHLFTQGALHAHILVWLRKREAAPNWQALPANPRTVKGHGPKQQKLCSAPATGVSTQRSEVHHDSCYQLAEMGRVSAELPRPIVTPVDFGGYDIEMLRVGALARTMLIRLKYLHICSPVYCLKETPALNLSPARRRALHLFLPLSRVWAEYRGVG